MAPLAALDDDALLTLLRAGDEAAFRALVDRHRPWLVGLCTRLLGHDAHAAEDAAQESLLKLHAAARRDGRPLRVRPWLTVVARNTCVDEQRRRRPDLPGELPERAAPGHDPFQLDAALADAWARLSGRHREVLYLREVLGFSYKEIGAVMTLTMPATETLVFRARAALRREYERSGGSAFGCGLLGLHLARFGMGRRREAGVTDALSRAAVNEAGFNGVGSRLAQFLTSLPGCGEQAVAKVLSVAAGVAMAAASVLPGLVPFADAPPAAAAGAPAMVSGQPGSGEAAAALTTPASAVPTPRPAATAPVTLKALLGNAVPADWTPYRGAAVTKPTTANEASSAGSEPRARRAAPLREAAGVVPSGDGPTLKRPVRGDTGSGPLRSILPARPGPADAADRPHPLRSLLADPLPLPLDPIPGGSPPSDPLAADPTPADSIPADPIPGTSPRGADPIPSIKDTADPLATFAGYEPADIRRRHRQGPG
ncbi:MAG TPA: sigma-70 family RNA polymerase sigma factor [Acidimicrobiia bacterium]|nr:sigma-70 family RNA polymerase sigma factor [Acidimicrobiia bacterium]